MIDIIPLDTLFLGEKNTHPTAGLVLGINKLEQVATLQVFASSSLFHLFIPYESLHIIKAGKCHLRILISFLAFLVTMYCI